MHFQQDFRYDTRTLAIVHVAQSLCLDIGAASNIYLSVCNQKDSQKWYFENIEWDGDSSKYKDVFKLHNVQAGGDCLV